MQHLAAWQALEYSRTMASMVVAECRSWMYKGQPLRVETYPR